ncbi:maleylpyruvate isomerase N-terminal domain-containing protein [Streptomyces sp. NK15101]|uniref:maleylpyruvate isomerase N-terminal domain-containing protein n=1 Tax=Streptomyces sp. NK15101 TaxID=2873261 RepID=UPI001CEC1DB3|nr:maleylpyruvate isomerase N-terminal domain-containing protein [Streptomyces sp. NK15101]
MADKITLRPVTADDLDVWEREFDGPELDAPAPDEPEISAAEYYRPDDRFSTRSNDTRIAPARDRAARSADGAAFAGDFAATWQRVDRLCRVQPAGRTVRTRHGDAMLLSEFLLARVVEVAAHGVDLADALGHEPWLTPSAGDAVTELLLGTEHVAATEELGWSRTRLLRKVTGREPLDEAGAEQIERLGLRWLALGRVPPAKRSRPVVGSPREC